LHHSKFADAKFEPMNNIEFIESQPTKRSVLEILASSRLPLIVWIVVLTTLFACTFGGAELLFYSVSGFSWIVALGFAVMISVVRFARISFRIQIWLPWIATIVAYSIVSDFPNLQRTVMLICPIVVGIAASTARIDDEQLSHFLLLMRVATGAVIGIVIVLAGLLLTGVLPESTAFAPQAIMTLILSVLFISSFSYGNFKDIFWYIAAACVPFIALTRGPMIVTGLSLPFTFAPIKLQTRLIMFILIALVSIGLFFTPRVQKKFFYSGRGSFEDLQDERKTNTSGRQRMAELLTVEIAQRPVFGHGANASESFILNYSRGQLTHPHNDWLRFLYDYGIVGTTLFAFTVIAQIRDLLRRGRHSTGMTQILFSAGASSFLSFAIMMFTDNIVLYAAFFGNLQFTMLGLAYAAERNARLNDEKSTSSRSSTQNVEDTEVSIDSQDTFEY
jgi:O-antigen ligase